MSPIFPRNPTFINTILLGGTPAQRIAAAHAAGFDQIEIWRQDVEAHEGGPKDLSGCLQKHGIGVTDYEVVRDFDGAPESRREEKRAEALSMLDTAVSIGISTVLVTASSDPGCIADRIDDDLRWLTREAASRRLRIAYEGLAWSAINYTLISAWECVKRVNESNLGIVIDPFHLFVRGGNVSDLDDIPMDRIFLIQLSDSNLDSCVDLQLVIDTARHRRILPGQGRLPIDRIVKYLKERNYAGPIGIEVFNDEMKALDPQTVAREAKLALDRAWSK
jgi:4-hydroxyphenylpyruvate dioxygenase